jgi:glycolate oxidase FAD binding subunit
LTLTWPEPPAGGPLGDGRFAHATDRPATVDDLCRVVSERVAQGHAIYPQGGGTALDYGGTPRAPGVAIDTRGLNRVIDYPAADMTVTVEAGITIGALGEVLAEQNQRLLVDAPFPDRATVGGVYATNTSGPRRLGAGRPRDQIIGVSFVTSAGAVVKGGGRVVKNVAGYDFPKLLTGSMGTLGVIAQVTLKVRPRPEASALVWAPFESADGLAGVLDRLNTSDARPMAVELLNPSASQRVGKPLRLPTGRWTVVVGLEDNAPSVAWQLDRLHAELKCPGSEVRQGPDAEPLWGALTGFQAEEDCGPLSFTASLRPSGVAGFVAGIDPGRWAVQAHAGNGIVRAYLLGQVDLEATSAEVARLRALVLRDGGSLILSRCPAGWKDRLKVWGDPRPDWALAERVKRALDPLGVMNPGRFVGTI